MRANPPACRDAASRPKPAGNGQDRTRDRPMSSSYVDCVLFGRRRTDPGADSNAPSPSQTRRAKQPGKRSRTDPSSLAAPAARTSEPERT
jgi:hypothetical protein